MKNKWKIIITIVATLGLGVVIGVLVSGNGGNGEAEMADHDQEVETIWTCSMHPQIRQPEPGDCPICGMDLIPLEKETEENPLLLTMTQTAIQLADIQTMKVGMATREKNISLTGQIEIDESQVIHQTTHFPGRIEQLNVQFEGQKVSKGERIATIYSPELITAQKELLEAYKYRDENPELYQAARNKLLNWKLSESQLQRILNTGAIIELFPIYADVSGVVSEIPVEPLDYLMTGGVIFSAIDLNNLWVVFNAYEQDLQWLEEGDRVQFNVPSLPGREFAATVTFIDPFINPETRSTELRAEISNPQGVLKPEMFVRAQINAARAVEGLQISIPRSAVMWTGKRSIVYIKVPGKEVPTFQLREVVLGPAMDNSYIIEEGLKAGEEVVVNGTFTIDAASQLQNKPSMMNPNIATKGQVEGGEIIIGVPEYADQTPAEFKQQVQTVLEEYLQLKNYLVDSDRDRAAKAAIDMKSALDEVNMMLLDGEPHEYWMQQLRDMNTHIKAIKDAADIGAQRKNFVFLSTLMADNLKAFGVNKGKFYLQFCPMANEDKGAYWLSAEEEVRNPYYGDEMLTCGAVREEIGE